MPDKDRVIIVPTDEVIIVPDKAVMVVRTDEEVAAAIMAAGPEFGKIHKSAKGEFFLKAKLSKR